MTTKELAKLIELNEKLKKTYSPIFKQIDILQKSNILKIAQEISEQVYETRKILEPSLKIARNIQEQIKKSYPKEVIKIIEKNKELFNLYNASSKDKELEIYLEKDDSKENTYSATSIYDEEKVNSDFEIFKQTEIAQNIYNELTLSLGEEENNYDPDGIMKLMFLVTIFLWTDSYIFVDDILAKLLNFLDNTPVNINRVNGLVTYVAYIQTVLLFLRNKQNNNK